MLQEIKNPAGGPGMVDGCGDGSFPLESHETFSLDCQGNYNSVHILLADVFDKYLALKNEIALLRAENARLRMIAGGGHETCR